MKSFLMIANSALYQGRLKDLFLKSDKDGFELLEIDPMESEWNISTLVNLSIRANNKTILLIDSNLCTNNAYTTPLLGVRFFKYLRMLGIESMCYVFGNHDLDELLNREPQNIILLSGGCQYINLENTKIELKETSKLNKSQLLKLYGLGVPEVSHDWNNLWGIYKLWVVHKCLTPGLSEKQAAEYLPKNILNVLTSYEGVLYRTLFNVSEDRVKSLLQQHFAETKLGILPKQNKYPESNVILIDDQANEGWIDIYDQLIGIKNSKRLKTIIPNRKDSVEGIFQQFKQTVEKLGKIHLLMLDVRLLGENGHFNDIHELSGIKLYKLIRERFPAIPVIITTASNNIGTYEAFINMPKPPNGYWIKEGINRRFSNLDSIQNYFNLFNQIHGVLGRRFEYEHRHYVSFDTDLNLDYANILVNRGFENIITEITLLNESPYFKKEKSKILKFSHCLIDTNFFFNTNVENSKLGTHITNVFQSIVLLCLIFEKRFLLHVNVLMEIYKFSTKSTFGNDRVISTAARSVLLLLKHMLEKDKIQVIGDNNIDILALIKEKDIYADNKLLSEIKKYDKPQKSLLFITNDKELKSRVKFTNTGSEVWGCNQVINHFMNTLKSI